jgi:hypothetical protein
VRAATRLLKALIPRTTVPEAAVMRGIARLNAGDMNLGVRVLFLKWVIAVYDLIDSKKQLWNLYGVLFLYLDYELLVRAPRGGAARPRLTRPGAHARAPS